MSNKYNDVVYFNGYGLEKVDFKKKEGYKDWVVKPKDIDVEKLPAFPYFNNAR